MIGIVDYGMGNLRSVNNAIMFLGFEAKLVSKTEDFNELSHLIIPGVGAFSSAMSNLNEANLIDPIKTFIASGKPALGICLGMQLLASFGFEPNETEGLNIIEGKVVKFQLVYKRIPHVGWNSIDLTREHYLFEGVKKGVDFYFVHSFYFDAKNAEDILAYCDYGMSFPAIVSKNNVTGIQFHPEKSQKNGLKILENFCGNVNA
jgi:glutamine amidotransferase